jgi:Zn-dependent peptidase ImmA (M78 family)
VLHPQQGCDGEVEERVLSKRRSPQLRRLLASAHTRSPREDEADAFASELLMPGKAVKAKFRQAFDCDSMPVWSSRLRGIIGREVSGPSRVRLAALSLAEKKGSLGEPLHDMFGVSKEAMARRLEQLHLVY